MTPNSSEKGTKIHVLSEEDAARFGPPVAQRANVVHSPGEGRGRGALGAQDLGAGLEHEEPATGMSAPRARPCSSSRRNGACSWMGRA